MYIIEHPYLGVGKIKGVSKRTQDLKRLPFLFLICWQDWFCFFCYLTKVNKTTKPFFNTKPQ